MSMFLERPQSIGGFLLNIGSEFGRPQNIFEEVGISPGVDSELVEEILGVLDPLIYDDGVNTGFVLVVE